MRSISRSIWGLLAIGGLLVVGVATIVVAFGDGSRRLGPAPLHADITVVPFSSVPLEGLTYADLEQFLQPLVAQHLAEGGPLQFRVQQQVLRSAREVAPVILRSSIISNAYDDLPAIAALRAASDYRGLARVALVNDGDAAIDDIAIRLPGVQTARITHTTVVADEDGPKGATKKVHETTVVKGEKSVIRIGRLAANDRLDIEAWLDRVPASSDWDWANTVRLASSAGPGSYEVHQMVSPTFERLDRNPLVSSAAIAVLIVLIATICIAAGTLAYWRIRERRRPARTEAVI